MQAISHAARDIILNGPCLTRHSFQLAVPRGAEARGALARCLSGGEPSFRAGEHVRACDVRLVA